MFNYDNLRGRIKAKGYLEKDFAKELQMTPASLSSKLNQKTDFTSMEIHKICEKLEIDLNEIKEYFFTEKLELNSTKLKN